MSNLLLVQAQKEIEALKVELCNRTQSEVPLLSKLKPRSTVQLVDFLPIRIVFVAAGHQNVLNGGIRPVLSPSHPSPSSGDKDTDNDWRHNGKTPRAVLQS